MGGKVAVVEVDELKAFEAELAELESPEPQQDTELPADADHELARAVGEAKKPETRARRVQAVVDSLSPDDLAALVVNTLYAAQLFQQGQHQARGKCMLRETHT